MRLRKKFPLNLFSIWYYIGYGIFILILIILMGLQGCISLNKSSTRKKEATVIESKENINKPKFSIPQIRKPRVFKSPILKVNKKMPNKDKQINVEEELEQVFKAGQSEAQDAESNKILNETERNNRFDNLIELEKEKDQIKEAKKSRTDVWMSWIGAIGVLSVFWTGVYFIARNLFYK